MIAGLADLSAIARRATEEGVIRRCISNKMADRRLPPDSQDEIALAMLTLSGHEGEPEEIDLAHLPAVLEGLAQAKRRQFATDAEVEAAFRRFEQ